MSMLCRLFFRSRKITMNTTVLAYFLRKLGMPAPTRKTVTASYTLTEQDNGTLIAVNSATSTTITVPKDLSDGFTCKVYAAGVGEVLFAAGSGATLVSASDHDRAGGQGALVEIAPVALNTYVLDGQTAADPG